MLVLIGDHRDRCRPGHVMDASPTGAERGRPGGHRRGSLHPGWRYAGHPGRNGPGRPASTPRRTASSRTTTRVHRAFGTDQLQVSLAAGRPAGRRFRRAPGDGAGGHLAHSTSRSSDSSLASRRRRSRPARWPPRETRERELELSRALDPDSCAAGWFTGNGVIHIAPVTNPDNGQPYSGGYVHVNSACNNGSYNDACSNGNGGLKRSGNASGQLIAPHIYVHGTCETAGERSPAQSLRAHRRSATH